MEKYFDERQSAAYIYGCDEEAIIRLLAERYIGENPETPYVHRAYDESGIAADNKAGYILDFGERFPESKRGARCFAVGELYSAEKRKTTFNISCKSPTKVWFDGNLAFSTSQAGEQNNEPQRFSIELKKGYNRFVLLCEKGEYGFGCRLQNAMPQWESCNFLMPFSERGGEAGFLFTAPFDKAEIDPAALFGESEAASRFEWLPKKAAVPKRDDGLYYGCSSLLLDSAMEAELRIPAGLRVWIDGKERSGWLPAGVHRLLSFGKPSQIAALSVRSKGARLEAPIKIHGRTTSYFVKGPYDAPADGFDFDIRDVNGGRAWTTGYEGIAPRPYAEARLFGRWTYPLGVTLYGMLRAGRLFHIPALTDYVSRHISAVTNIQAYAKYDTEKYGFAGVNQQLCWLDALDDCGSFGSLILEADQSGENANIRKIADEIAEYMLNAQPRTEDGAFIRRDKTIWADDMYMSVPFLSRYASYANCPKALDECAKQLLLYKKLLFIMEKRVMSHMRDEKRGESNGIPWSRGNGWVIFSLSELLERLPESHEKRKELLGFFRELTQGYIALQDESGLWHQVLDEPSAYLEASSTAMMICAFSRGVLGGWYTGELSEAAQKAAEKAWRGLCETTIDAGGNLYGVCRGSGYSFSRDYYKALSWSFNDTHGIGIVMLAAAELKRLKTRMANEEIL